jgi:gamma-glutamyltranspeptidase/glutathione hydrolase
MRNLELPGRSPAMSIHGMAATSHPLATMTAIAVLRDGGTAMDAAVAACAVQCVVEPQSTGIGGDCFVLMAPGGGDGIIGFNGSGRAPAAATVDWFRRQGVSELARNTAHSVTVPGAVDAWGQLVRDHGRKSLGELLQPAIAFARDGYPVHQRVSFDWAREAELLRRDPTARRIFLPQDRAPRAGDVHRQPELARTLTIIAEEGPDGFYKGPVAEDIVTYLQSLGGCHTLEDFAGAHGEYVTPIKTGYRGYEVYECPPNGQGIVALEMLNILSGFDLAGLDPVSVERLHLEAEAAKLAYRDRDAMLADPDQASVPVAEWLSEERAERLRQMISPERALTELPSAPIPAHMDTVYITVVDKDRNAVSFINSLFESFGSGLVSPKTGVVLQNRGSGFSLDPSHPNCVAPGKRPLHTIIPAMLCRDGRAAMSFGVMGGHYQACGHAHLLTNLIDYGLDVQQAIDQPRIFPLPGAKSVDMESGVPDDVVDGLRKLGHRPSRPKRPIGGAQAVQIDWKRGVLTGGSDPRKDGCALGY